MRERRNTNEMTFIIGWRWCVQNGSQRLWMNLAVRCVCLDECYVCTTPAEATTRLNGTFFLWTDFGSNRLVFSLSLYSTMMCIRLFTFLVWNTHYHHSLTLRVMWLTLWPTEYVLNNTNTTAPKSPNTFTVVCVVLTFKWVFYVPLVIAHSHTHTWNTTKVFNVSFWNVGFNFYSEYYTTSILQTFDTCATFSVYQCIRNSVK